MHRSLGVRDSPVGEKLDNDDTRLVRLGVCSWAEYSNKEESNHKEKKRLQGEEGRSSSFVKQNAAARTEIKSDTGSRKAKGLRQRASTCQSCDHQELPSSQVELGPVFWDDPFLRGSGTQGKSEWSMKAHEFR